MDRGSLERFAAGSLEDFEAVFREFQGPVHGWIASIVRDRAAAEDLTVETFWRAWRAHARFDASREFGPWARRIATRVALSYLKSAPRLAPLPLDAAAGGDGDAGLREAVRAAFAALPPKLRAVAALALVDGRSYQEIGGALGISAAAVKSREFRAVRLLRRRLAKGGYLP